MSDQFEGTGVALVTPFLKAGAIDFPGLERVTNHVIGGGVDYLVVMGTTGENPTLSWDEQLTVLTRVSEIAADRVPIVFGHGGNNTSSLLARFDELEKFNLKAILSVCPYYNRPSQGGMVKHFTTLADRSPFDIILYNVPARTCSTLHPETIKILANHPRIIGLKDAVGNLDYTRQVINMGIRDFWLVSGDDNLTLDIMEAGGIGVISVLGNCLPHEVCGMVRLALKKHMDEAYEINQKLEVFYELITREGNPSSIKGSLAGIGLCNATVRLPLDEASASLVETFSKEIDKIKKDN